MVCGQPGRFCPLVRRMIKTCRLMVMLMKTMFAEVVRDAIKIKGNNLYESFLS